MILTGTGEPKITIDTLGFHAQQAVEKSFKAVLALKTGDYPKIHDLLELMDLLADHGVRLPPKLENADMLTPFATVFRYAHSATDDTAQISRSCLLELAKATIEWAKSEIGA